MESDVRCSSYPHEHSKVGIIRERVFREGLADSRSLLNDPNTSSPANVEASNLYKDNRREYTKRVRETVEKSWED